MLDLYRSNDRLVIMIVVVNLLQSETDYHASNNLAEHNDSGSQSIANDVVCQNSIHGNQRDDGTQPSENTRVRSIIAVVAHHDCVIIEWCCGRNSMLGQPSR
jgi:hypothetical protein